MNDHSVSYRHFSAEVDIRLQVAERDFDVWSMGPNSIVLKEPQEITAGDGKILLSVDKLQYEWKVNLPFGSVPFDSEVEIIPQGRLALIDASESDPPLK